MEVCRIKVLNIDVLRLDVLRLEKKGCLKAAMAQHFILDGCLILD